MRWVVQGTEINGGNLYSHCTASVSDVRWRKSLDCSLPFMYESCVRLSWSPVYTCTTDVLLRAALHRMWRSWLTPFLQWRSKCYGCAVRLHRTTSRRCTPG